MSYAEEIWQGLKDILNYELVIDKDMQRKHDVTLRQAIMLLELPDADSISLSQLNKGQVRAGSTMTRLFDQLVMKGLVERFADPDKRREVRVALTDAGRERKHTLQGEFQQFFEALLTKIPAADHASTALALRRVGELIRIVDEEKNS